jgi:hypothetical protein
MNAVTRLSYLPWFDYNNNIWQRIQIMKVLIIHLSLILLPLSLMCKRKEVAGGCSDT